MGAAGQAAPAVPQTAMEWWIDAPLPAGSTVVFRDTTETVSVPSGSGPLLIHVLELPEEGGTEVGVSLMTPGETVVDSAYCAANEGYTYAKGVDHIYYRVETPESEPVFAKTRLR